MSRYVRRQNGEYYFATAPFVRTRAGVGGQVTRDAVGPVHAKKMGTTRTVCGMAADSWVKVFEQPFLKVDQRRQCAECAHALVDVDWHQAAP